MNGPDSNPNQANERFRTPVRHYHRSQEDQFDWEDWVNPGAKREPGRGRRVLVILLILLGLAAVIGLICFGFYYMQTPV